MVSSVSSVDARLNPPNTIEMKVSVKYQWPMAARCTQDLPTIISWLLKKSETKQKSLQIS